MKYTIVCVNDASDKYIQISDCFMSNNELAKLKVQPAIQFQS